MRPHLDVRHFAQNDAITSRNCGAIEAVVQCNYLLLVLPAYGWKSPC